VSINFERLVSNSRQAGKSGKEKWLNPAARARHSASTFSFDGAVLVAGVSSGRPDDLRAARQRLAAGRTFLVPDDS
jgi:hypothetical protein